MDIKVIFEVFSEEVRKVFMAFTTWGIGILIMLFYCFFLIWVKSFFGLYVAILGCLLFMTLAFFIIDFWWNYKRIKQIRKIKDS